MGKKNKAKKFNNGPKTDTAEKGEIRNPANAEQSVPKHQSDVQLTDARKSKNPQGETPRNRGNLNRNRRESRNGNQPVKTPYQDENYARNDDVRDQRNPRPPLLETTANSGHGMKNPSRIPSRRQSESEVPWTPLGRRNHQGTQSAVLLRKENDAVQGIPKNWNMNRGDRSASSYNLHQDRRSVEQIDQIGSRNRGVRGQHYNDREGGKGSSAVAKNVDVNGSQHNINADASIMECGQLVKREEKTVKPRTAHITVDVRDVRLHFNKEASCAVEVTVEHDMVARGFATHQWLTWFLHYLPPCNRGDMENAVLSELLDHVNCKSGVQGGFTTSKKFVLNDTVISALKNVFEVLFSLAHQFFFILAASEGFHAPDMLVSALDNIDELLNQVQDFNAEISLFVDCVCFLKENDQIAKLDGFSMLEEVFRFEELIKLIADSSHNSKKILSTKNINFVLADPLLCLKYGKPYDKVEVTKVLREELADKNFRSLVVLMEKNEDAACTFEREMLSVFLRTLPAVCSCIDRRVQQAAYEWLTQCLNALKDEWDEIAAEFQTVNEMKGTQKWRTFFRNILAEKLNSLSENRENNQLPENPLHTLLTSRRSLEEMQVDIFLMFLISSYSSSADELGLLDYVADTFVGFGGHKTEFLKQHQVDNLVKGVEQLPKTLRDQLTDSNNSKSLYHCVTSIVNRHCKFNTSEENLRHLLLGVYSMGTLLSPLRLLSDVLLPLMDQNMSLQPPNQNAHIFVAALMSPTSKFIQRLASELKESNEAHALVGKLVKAALNLYRQPNDKAQKVRYRFIGSMLEAVDVIVSVLADSQDMKGATELIKEKLSPVQYKALICSFFQNWESLTEKICIDSLESLNGLSIVEIFKSWPWNQIYIGLDRIFTECFSNATLDKLMIGCRLAKILGDADLFKDSKELCQCFRSRLDQELNVDSTVLLGNNVETTVAHEVDSDKDAIKKSVENAVVEDDGKRSRHRDFSEANPLVAEMEYVMNSAMIPQSIKSVFVRVGRGYPESAIRRICETFSDSSHQVNEHEQDDEDELQPNKAIKDSTSKKIVDFSRCEKRSIFYRVFAVVNVMDELEGYKLVQVPQNRDSQLPFSQVVIQAKTDLNEEKLDSVRRSVEQRIVSLVPECSDWLEFKCKWNSNISFTRSERIEIEEDIMKKTGIKLWLQSDHSNIQQTCEKIDEKIADVHKILKDRQIRMRITHAYTRPVEVSNFEDQIAKWNEQSET